MSAYDSPSVSSSPLSNYKTIVETAKAEAAEFENYVRTDVVQADEAAEKKANGSYKDLQYAKGVFDLASNNKYTLEQQLKKLEEEKNRRITEAKEKNKDKTPEEIDKICSAISAEYADRIINLRYNITLVNKSASLKYDTLFEAEKTYRQDRFSNIATSNNVWSGFLEASQKWFNVGKLQKHQQFLQIQYDNIQNKKDGFNALG